MARSEVCKTEGMRVVSQVRAAAAESSNDRTAAARVTELRTHGGDGITVQ
jgi:hypothetical protein